jgi:hypothetical protein
VTENDEELLPVPLRLGERSLGGALSWTKPQPVAKFPSIGPFSELSAPQDVTVNRQVLAEPTPDLADHTWASLADGTPLVTGAKRGKGTLVLFHVTPEATWSNLPISGSFVEMLHRIASLSRNQGAITNGAGETAQSALPPYRMVAADGTLGPPSRSRIRPGSMAARTASWRIICLTPTQSSSRSSDPLLRFPSRKSLMRSTSRAL